jgi:hypothetical protein
MHKVQEQYSYTSLDAKNGVLSINPQIHRRDVHLDASKD